MNDRYAFGRYTLRGSCVIIASVALLAGCAKNEPPGKPQEEIVATVNGKSIGATLFETYVTALAHRPVKDLTPDQRAHILDQFIAMQLAADSAEKSGMAKKSDVESQLALMRMNVLSDAAIKKYLEDHPITDDELKAEYDTQVAGAGREYHARHILVESRATADELLTQLKSGADFAKLAEKKSIDGSAKNGGDLGWFSLKAMVPQFSNAVATLEKGKYTLTPVQTQFGWHIIKLEDTRAPAPPAFADVKEQVKSFVQRKKAQVYLDDLRKSAKIDKPEEKKEAAAAPMITIDPKAPKPAQ